MKKKTPSSNGRREQDLIGENSSSWILVNRIGWPILFQRLPQPQIRLKCNPNAFVHPYIHSTKKQTDNQITCLSNSQFRIKHKFESIEIRRRQTLYDRSTFTKSGSEDPIRVLKHAIFQTDNDELTTVEACFDQTTNILCM
ncbi:hypothetical protein EYC84_001908 [Monilinia fructicola]|uniref:Uncharacterized protein n=1 Tax=Monilinia fructicola TaxID=38448 RepID=A0A5M9JTF6_MONFR|nr:hypothetical protein EYC84_001908 [Monilinia fructicola]